MTRYGMITGLGDASNLGSNLAAVLHGRVLQAFSTATRPSAALSGNAIGTHRWKTRWSFFTTGHGRP